MTTPFIFSVFGSGMRTSEDQAAPEEASTRVESDSGRYFVQPPSSLEKTQGPGSGREEEGRGRWEAVRRWDCWQRKGSIDSVEGAGIKGKRCFTPLSLFLGSILCFISPATAGPQRITGERKRDNTACVSGTGAQREAGKAA